MEHSGESGDVPGGSAAASAYQSGAGPGGEASEVGKIVGSRAIDDAAFLIGRASRIRIDGKGAGRGDFLHEAKHGLGAVDAVQAHEIGPFVAKGLQDIPDPGTPGEAACLR